MNLDKKDLFSTFYLGDKGIDKLTEEAYVIIGLTKMGKSTFTNYLLDRPMIGSVDPEFAHKTIYLPNIVPKGPSKNYAPMGNNFESLTLYPNIEYIGNKCCVIDMAGFEENRNQVGVMAVSYFLISVFEKLKRFRFIMVTTEEVLFSSNIRQFCRPFEELFSLFSYPLLNAELKKTFMSSVSLIISCANQPQKYYREFLTKLAKRLGKETLEMISNKPLIIQMLEAISGQNHVDVFELAKVGVVTEKCNILSRLEKQNWNFFDIQKAEKQMKKKILVIPFSRDYQSLKQNQKEKITMLIENRTRAFIQMKNIFHSFLTHLRYSWSTGLKKQVNTSVIFAAIQKFLAIHYPYGGEIKFDQVKLIPNNSKQDIFNIVYKSLELYDLNNELQNGVHDWQSLSFGEKMMKYNKFFPQMIDCLLPLCTQSQQHELLLKLKFLLGRGFSEFPKLYQLKKQLISNMGREILDANTDAITSLVDKRNHFENFVNAITRQCLIKHFFSLEDLCKFEDLLAIYELTMKNQVKNGANKQGQARRLKINGLKIEIKSVIIELMEINYSIKWQRIKKYTQLAGSLCNHIVMMTNNNFYRSYVPQSNQKTERIMAESLKLGQVDKQKNQKNVINESSHELQIKYRTMSLYAQQNNNTNKTPKRAPNYKQYQAKPKMNNFISEQNLKRMTQTPPLERKELTTEVKIENINQQDSRFQEINFKLITTINSICECLLQFNNTQFPKSNKYALDLSKFIKDVYMANEIYQKVLNQQTQRNKQIEVLNSYIDFCFSWGKFETAIELLHRKRHIYLKDKNMVRYRETNIELNQIFDRSNRSQKEVRMKIEEVGQLLSSSEVEKVMIMLTQIVEDVSKQQKRVKLQEKPPSMILKSVS